ncbi:CoA-transferase [Aurantimonas sp. VKM B-3413]|uniref:CoA transferase subunit A n=1 Tax=Aurantimonas sp. VKM B-3413 TaxID=2779401 RepID=UPI001E2F40F2|nr:hypothetical protein [Aurantimonas sp. VKM B-3413]
MSAQDKVATLADAAGLIENGTLLALGGDDRGQPAALCAELIRHGRRDLRLAGHYRGFAAELLIRSGCGRAECLPVGAVRGQDLFPSDRNGIGASQQAVFARLHAAAMGLPFLPLADGSGDELASPVADPLTGKAVRTVPALHPDISVIHADAADEHGNVLIVEGRRDAIPADIVLARAARKVIVTVEQIVSRRTIAARPQDLALRAEEVAMVVEAPYGAHPTGFSNRYRPDEEALAAFCAAGAAEASLADWLGRWVEAPGDHMAYLERLGARRLMDIALSRRAGLG